MIERYYSDRILEIVRIWGEFTAAAQIRKNIGASDGLIAATALRHSLHIVTRNISDFEPSGGLLINSWEWVFCYEKNTWQNVEKRLVIPTYASVLRLVSCYPQEGNA